MKLSVTKGFIDKETNIFHQIGEVVEYPEARAKFIETRGFGKCLDKPKSTKTETQETKEEKEPKERRNRVSEETKREARRR